MINHALFKAIILEYMVCTSFWKPYFRTNF